MQILDAAATAKALAWPTLVAAIEVIIRDVNAGLVTCPPRVSLPVSADAVWLLMPAWSASADIAACKLITVHPRNPQRGLPTIQGDILVIRASTGERLALLDGPTVTARRTAAVTAVGIKLIQRARRARSTATADVPSCLIIGCGVQGRSHLEAIHATAAGAHFFPPILPPIFPHFFLYSRSARSAAQLAEYAVANGISAQVVDQPEAVLKTVDIIACCTPALDTCLHDAPREGAIIAAIGSFKPEMSEIDPQVMRTIGRNILLDTDDARHEAGELIQAGIDARGLPTLLTWRDNDLPAIARTVLFKSCGSALWDLAAAQAAVGPLAPDIS